jgi:hypothetical protein
MVVYKDGCKKEWLKDKMVCYYANGKEKYEMSRDSSSGTSWDEKGAVLTDLKDFILTDHSTGAITYYVAKGKNEKALKALLAKHQWSSEQIADFKNANKVRVSAAGFLSVSTYGYEVSLD